MRESNDFTVVLMDAEGASIADTNIGTPSFVGILPRTLRQCLAQIPIEDWQEGDCIVTNEGWGLVAATYPGDHPALIKPKSDLDLESWASALAALVAETVGQDKGRPIIAFGWSMGGKLAFALTRALRLKGQPLTRQRLATKDRTVRSA
ncbi:pimeloyl-ACP methyl ester carboxylesterase [Bradyrhizobium sp. GM24.11]